MKYFLVLCFVFFLSCDNSKGLTPEQLRTGTFKTILNDTVSSLAIRNATKQIETYDDEKFEFDVFWNSDFEYSLKRINPKNALDSTEFIVKITGIHKNTYTFKAHYKGFKYFQEGKAIRISD